MSSAVYHKQQLCQSSVELFNHRSQRRSCW